MREQLIKLSQSLFGLEYEILMTVSQEEKNKFFKLSFLYLLVAIVCIISSIYLFFLISSSFWFALLIGPLLGLVFLSVIRFSILTIQRSLYEKKTTEIPADKNFLLTDKNKISGVLNKVRFPGIETLMRILINGIMGFLIIFPLVSLMNFMSLESLNQQKRDVLLNDFITSKHETFSVENENFNGKIKQLELTLSSMANLKSQGGVYTSKEKELINVKAQQNLFIKNFATDLDLQSRELKEYLNSKYFIIFTLTKAVSYPEFIYISFAIFGLLFYMHYLQYILKSNETYQYTKLANEKYINIVLNDYNHTKLQIEKTLKKKFPNQIIDIDGLSRWKNPPFNTDEKIIFPNRKSILKSELIQSLNTK